MFGKNASALKAALALLWAGAALQDAGAATLFAQKYDTFISQAQPQEDFSREKYMRVSGAESAKAIAYLPFYLDHVEIGFQPERDKIMSAQLILRFKAAGKDENKAAGKKNGAGKPAETIKNGSGEQLKCEYKIYALTDGETFAPNAENARVSWNGKNRATAPKHNNIDDELADDGLFEVGAITINFGADQLENGGEIEFTSDKLAEFLNFAYGAASAQGMHTSFRPQVDKIGRICLILKQTAGALPLEFYSADSYEDGESGKGEKTFEPRFPQGGQDAQEPGEGGEAQDLRPKIIFEFRSVD